MKITDTISRAGRNLRRAKMRTLLTSVAIAVGGFAIMVSLMAGEGARQYVDRVISVNMNPDSIMIAKDKSSFGMSGGQSGELREYNPDSVSMYGAELKALTEKDVAALRQRTDIKEVEPYFQVTPKFVEFSSKPDKKYLARVEMRDNTLAMATGAGRQFSSGTQLKDDEAILPEGYLEHLGIKNTADAIGKTLAVTVSQAAQKPDEAALLRAYMNGGEAAVGELVKAKTETHTFTIVAVSKKSPEQAMSSGSFISISPSAARQLVEFSTVGTDQYQKYAGVNALVSQGKSPQSVKEALEKDGYGALTAKDMQSMIFTFVNILQSIVMGFGILALIVSIFGIVNTMYISVLERTQQIGLMKALGASKKDIGRLFRYEAAWVGALGGALGVLLAWAAATLANPVISDKLGLGQHSLLIFQPLPALGVVVCLALVAIIAGWLPSRRAAKLDPIEALRTE